MPRKHPQTDLFDTKNSAHKKRTDRFGGNQRRNRASRRARPISTRTSMHLMLKSLKARGAWSFLHPRNKRIIKEQLELHSVRNGVDIMSLANVGNHLHIHLKARSVAGFKAFVRAFTGAIALKITGANKFTKLKEKFWTQTPYTRFVHGLVDYLRLKDYLEINNIEGFGYSRKGAELYVRAVSRTRQRFRNLSGGLLKLAP